MILHSKYTTLLVFMVSWIVFYLEYQLPYSTDISDHLLIVKSMNVSAHPIPGHFLYFFIVALLSGFSTHHQVLIIVSATVLALSVAFKKVAAEYMVYAFIPDLHKNLRRWVAYVCTLSVFMILLPTKPPFTLPWPPISWLNSTSIFVFPLCILLFYVSYQYMVQNKRKYLIDIIILSVLILISKPSYLFVFMMAFPIMKFLIEKKINRTVLQSLLISLFISFLILLQYMYIYNYMIHQVKNSYTDVQLIISPMSAWHRISSHIPLSFLLWFGFPIVSSILLNKILFKDKLYLYALINFIIGLMIFILMEEVHRESHHPIGSVNFIWQVLIGLYLLNISIITVIFKNINNDWQFIFKVKNIIIIFTFLYYSIGGMIYLYQTILKQFLI